MDPLEHLPSGYDRDGSNPAADGTPLETTSEHIDSWSDLALDLLDGALTPMAAATLNAHLASCTACRVSLEEQLLVADLMRAVPPVQAPAALEGAILSHLSELRSAGALEVAPAEPRHEQESGGAGMLARVRALMRPRVWLPAAALAVILGVAVTSYYPGGFGGSDGDRAADTGDAMKAAAPSAETGTTTGDTEAMKESTLDDVAGSAAVTTTTAASLPADSGPDVPPELSPTVQIEALGAAVGSDPPVVWVTVKVRPDEAGNAALILGSLTDLPPLEPPGPASAALPAYAALISTEDVDAFAATLGISELHVLSLTESAGLLPPEISGRLEQGPATLPLLQPAATGEGTPAYGWPTRDRLSTDNLVGLVILVVTLSPSGN